VSASEPCAACGSRRWLSLVDHVCEGCRDRMREGARVRVRATGRAATVTHVTVPYMRLVRVDGDEFETHLKVSALEFAEGKQLAGA
jgi:hypothetical protein